MYDANEIAIKINQILKEKQLSQKDMLENCKLSKNAISSMLSRGSMLRADNLARIADYLDCSIDYLVGRSTLIRIQKSELSSKELLFIEKLRALPEDSQDEIIHMLNYKYEQYQKKRKRLSSTSGSTTTDDHNNMLA